MWYDKDIVYKKVVDLGKVAYTRAGRACKVTLEIKLKPIQHRETGRTIDLEPIPDNALELSICGNIWNHLGTDIYSGGQNLDTISQYLPHNKDFARLVQIWDRWHLNGLKAGTRVQLAFVEGYKAAGGKYDYTEVKKAMGDLAVDRGYSYGSAWLTELLPDEIIEEIKILAESLDKAPIPC